MRDRWVVEGNGDRLEWTGRTQMTCEADSCRWGVRGRGQVEIQGGQEETGEGGYTVTPTFTHSIIVPPV